MSHPYFPQSRYSYRPGFPYQTSVPASYGFGGYSAQSGRRVLGSLSPKYDWATPSYVKSEPDGTAGYGYDVQATFDPTLSQAIFNNGAASPSSSSGATMTCLKNKLMTVPDYILDKMGIPDFMKSVGRSIIASAVNKLAVKISDVVWNAVIKGGRDEFIRAVDVDVKTFFGNQCINVMGSQQCLPTDSISGWIYDYLYQQYNACITTTDTSALAPEVRDAADEQYCAQQTEQPGLNWYLPGRGCVSSDEYQMILAMKAAAAQALANPPPGTPYGCARWLGQPGDWGAGVIDWRCNHYYMNAAGQTIQVLPAPGQIEPPYNGRELFVVDVATLTEMRNKINAAMPQYASLRTKFGALCRGQLIPPGQSCTGTVIPATAPAGGGAAIAAVAGIAAIAYFMMK